MAAAKKKYKHRPHDLRDQETVGFRLRERRLELGWTGARVDIDSGKKIGCLSTIESRNSKVIHPDTAQRYAKALGLNWIWVLTGQGDRLSSSLRPASNEDTERGFLQELYSSIADQSHEPATLGQELRSVSSSKHQPRRSKRMAESDDWKEAAEASAADKGGSRFVSLKNEGDKSVGMLVGGVATRYVAWIEPPGGGKGKPVPFTAEHKAKGLDPTTFYIMNFFEFATGTTSKKTDAPRDGAHLVGKMKQIELNNFAFKDVLKLRDKHESAVGKEDGLNLVFVEAEKKGKYVGLAYERHAKPDEIAAIMAMPRKTKEQLLAGKGEDGAGDPDADMNSHEKGAAKISGEQCTSIINRLKILPKEKGDTYKAWLKAHNYAQTNEILVKDWAEIDALASKLAAPPAAPDPVAEMDPFAQPS